MSKPKRRPSKRQRAYSLFCRWLTTVYWSILPAAEQREALVTAFEFGQGFADDWDDEPNRTAYVETCVMWCYRQRYHVNDVELAIWAKSPELEADPRVIAFAAGALARRRELGQ